MKRLIAKSRFKGQKDRSDSLKTRRRQSDGRKYDRELYDRAEQAWDNMSKIRETYMRNCEYVFGDQWGDYVQDEMGNWVKERERIARRTGGVALQNNHLIKIINALTGIESKSTGKPAAYARLPEAGDLSTIITNALQANWDINDMREVLSYELLMAACGGIEWANEQWDVRDGVEDSYTYIVNLLYGIIETQGDDPRHWDVSLIGEIKDYTIGELAARLAHSAYDYRQLEDIYRPWQESLYQNSTRLGDRQKGLSFEQPLSNTYCRTYELWTLEHKRRYRCVDMMDFEQPVYRIERKDLPIIQAENEQRLADGLAQGLPEEEIPLIEYKEIVDQYWHFTMLGPDGIILDEYDSPYEHKSHPYSIKMHTLVNGKPIPFISCVIDQQRYINRLITLHDLIVNASAKGVKFIPKSAVPSDMTEDEFARKFVEYDGFIFYEAKPGMPEPKMFSNTAQTADISTLLQMEVNFVNDITSISGALLGNTPAAGTAASRYAMETENSNTAIAAFFAHHAAFKRAVAKKKMDVIHQFYTSPRNISVVRSNGYVETSLYNPIEVQDIPYVVSLADAPDTPVARMVLNDTVKELWAAGQLTPEQFISLSNIPAAEPIVRALKENGTSQQMTDPTQLAQMQQMAGNNSMQRQQ